jgi:quercetin 2,3-dioxygenase
MHHVRTVRRIVRSIPTMEGAGVRLQRAFGFGDTSLFDPFLLLDAFGSSNPREYERGFPWHPHRGIETITYVLDGEVEHADSLGNHGTIGPGSVQWMTAGSGIIHHEMPIGDSSGAMRGFQLWANLPRADKMMAPRYQQFGPDRIPVVPFDGATAIRVIAGELDGVKGPVTDVMIQPRYFDVTMPAGRRCLIPVPEDHTCFAYLFEGEAFFDEGLGSLVTAGHLVLLETGENVAVTSAGTGARFIFVSGKPLGEPIAWHGPIVMNSQEEIELAVDEFQKGTFVKSGKR